MKSRRSPGEGSIRQRSANSWEVRVSGGIDFATGKKTRVTRYARSKEEATKLLHELAFTLNHSPKLFNTITLEEWLEMTLEVYMKNTIKQSTYNSYRSYINIHLVPALGSIFLSELDPRTLQMFYNHKMEVEGLSPKTIHNINLFLHKALSFAVSEGFLKTNPAGSLNLPASPKPKIDILSREEQTILIRASYAHRYGIFIRLTLFTGLRLGELLGLRWEDIDFYQSMLNVNRTLGRLNKTEIKPGENTTEIVIGTPKSDNSIRSIPLLPNIQQELLGWKQVQENEKAAAGEAYTDSGFIVTNPLGGFVEPRTFRDYYEQILQISGLRHLTYHALRHTFATRALEQGMDAKTLSILLGHYSVSFTMDTYTHVQDRHKTEAISLMDEIFQEAQVPQSNVYPAVVRTEPDGSVSIRLPDFPGVECSGTDFTSSICLIKEKLGDELLTTFMQPYPTPPAQIPLGEGEMILQITC